MTAGLGVMEVVVMFAMMFGGGAALGPMGVPLPPDKGLHSAAPAECLLYFGYAGQAKPEAGGKNEVENLFAEPEIQGFFGEVDRLIDEGVKLIPAESEEQRVVVRNLPTIVRTLLTRPSMFYVGEVQVPPAQPGGNAAVVVNAGEHRDAFIGALEEFEKLYLTNIPPNQVVEKSEVGGAQLRRLPMPPQAPPLVWGVKGDYVFLALGEGEAENIVKRLAASTGPPDWLSDLQSELAVPRTASLAYVNVASIIKLAEPLFPLIGEDAPPPLRDIGKLLDATGLRHLKHVALASGLGEETAVTKIVVAHDGKAEGLLNFVVDRPLKVDEFRAVPADCEFASVGRFDAKKAFDVAMQVVEQIDPQARSQADEGLAQAQKELGFSLENDLLAGLGDTWTIYSSASEGGLLFTGLCLTVDVRDRKKVERVLDLVLRKAEAEARRPDDRAVFSVLKTAAGDKQISYVQVAAPWPVAPAWCFDGDKLVIALSPQMVRSHVARPKDVKTLADSKLIQDKLASGDVTSLSYQNTQLGLQFLYSYAQFLATAGAGALEQETGIRADLSKFPSLGSISRHMRPNVHVTRVTKTGLIMESYATGPTIDLFSAPGLGIAMGLLVPAGVQARSSALDMASMNNMRNIGLAMINYEQANGRLPKNIVDADGNPTLSWRVELLPHLDQQALYEQFRRDEPWDSEHNRKLLAKMPEVFAAPDLKLPREQGKTAYQIPTGPGTLFDARDIRLGELGNSGVTSYNAAMLIQSDPVEWTKPQDVKLDLQNFAGKLPRDRQGRTKVMTADGAVRFFSLDELKELEEAVFPR